MPSFEDYDKDEEQQGAGGGGSRGGGMGGGGAQLAQATPQKESTFVPWSRFVSANEDVSNRNANALNSQVSGDVNAANKGISDASNAFNKQIESNYQHDGDQVAAPNESFGQSAAGSFGQPSQATTGVFGQRQADQQAARQSAQQAATSQFAPPTDASRMGMLQQGKAPGAAAPGGAQRGLYAAPQPGNRIGINAQGLNNPAGAKDLESSLGADAWGKLMGDTTHATSEANALNSQTGVQGLVQKQAGAPLAQNGAFDAALEYGHGRPAFQQTAQAGKALSGSLQNASQQSQNAWHSLMGDVSRAQGEQSAYDKMNQPAGVGQNAQQYDQPKLDQDLRDARDQVSAGIAAYSSTGAGKSGSVNTLGDRDGFLNALSNGDKYGDGVKGWDNSPTVQQQTDAACKALGISQEDFVADIKKMNDEEYQNFWLLGVIPTWMDVGQSGQSFGKGVVGGWQSPFIHGVTGYGSDGGMWNAVTNMWKDGAKTIAEGVAGGPSGAVSAGVKATSYKGPGGGK